MSLDANAVERFVDDFLQHRLGVGRFERGVGHQRREHRRHIRADHRGALAHPGEAVRFAVLRNRLTRNDFHLGVGRHDGGRGLFEIVESRPERRSGGRGAFGDPLHRKLDADNAGRHHERLVAGRADRLGGEFGHFTRVFEPERPGAGVGDAGVRRDDADPLPRRQRTVVSNRRAAI